MKRIVLVILCLSVMFMVTGCKNKETPAVTVIEDVKLQADVVDVTADTKVAEASNFDYSQVFDENGYIQGVKASDLVKDMFAYDKLSIPKDSYSVSEDAVKEQLQHICDYYHIITKITDRVVQKDDRVNIDYVGTIDGKEFEGGNTNKTGTTVTAGSEEYIDDFLTQIIGYKPGETFDVLVTFPVEYGSEDVAGKEAKFVTTINYIEGEGKLTDADVVANLSFANGWQTVAEAEQGIRDNLQKGQIHKYIYDSLITYAQTGVDLLQIPQEYRDYYDKVTVAYFQDLAAQSNLSLNEYIKTYTQVDDRAALLAKYRDSNVTEIRNSVVIQAIAEKENIQITDQDLRAYLDTNTSGADDFDKYQKQFGLAYMKHIVLQQKVTNFIYDHAVLEK